MIDLFAVRADTPGVEHGIHLNNAGAALMPRPVLDAMTGHLRREAEIGGYEAAGEAQRALDGVYASVANLLGARAEEIALTENATVAWQMAFYSFTFKPGDRILTARAEYAANYVAFLHAAKTHGVTIDVVPNDHNGVLDPEALESMIDDRVRLIAMTWVPTNGGLINPAAEVGRIARRHDVPYLLDACQAVGQMPVNVQQLGCDMLTAPGRKFLRGPRGTGFLYVRQSLLEHLHPPVIDHFAAPWVEPDRYELRADARRFETWENNYAARLGLGVAIDYALSLGLEHIEARCKSLGTLLRAELSRLPGVHVYDLGPTPAAIISFSIDGHEAETVRNILAEAGIHVSLSKASSTLLDAKARALPTLIRASPHYYNTEEEILALVERCRRLTS
ncbi:aminotransferase class V-fold PLP-dependent enzyme [Rhizobium lusitanum]|uniref:Selenocysteine lyase/cysteine desulfurase n=1 Tax=Rhizobium lusitanum TaxID=293958 RepID=A0A7X0IYD2_9HYPH|nr:aminotransferase class V-fold PLP-dependent enzyme [Rhizobium lusitanum]MBB6489133.1 selenocysteine lyase/cysteine desulfurase [Rhizobium lusitanum]